MNQRKKPPTIVYRGVRQDITPYVIVLLVKEGLRPIDYEILDLTRDYYGFASIGDLIADAFDRAGVSL